MPKIQALIFAFLATFSVIELHLDDDIYVPKSAQVWDTFHQVNFNFPSFCLIYPRIQRNISEAMLV